MNLYFNLFYPNDCNSCMRHKTKVCIFFMMSSIMSHLTVCHSPVTSALSPKFHTVCDVWCCGKLRWIAFYWSATCHCFVGLIDVWQSAEAIENSNTAAATFSFNPLRVSSASVLFRPLPLKFSHIVPNMFIFISSVATSSSGLVCSISHLWFCVVNFHWKEDKAGNDP